MTRSFLLMLLVACCGCEAAAVVKLVEPIGAGISYAQRQARERERLRVEHRNRHVVVELVRTLAYPTVVGDCAKIAAIELQIAAIPVPRDTPDEFHHLFLREPATRPCLARRECDRVRSWLATHHELADDPYMQSRLQATCNPQPAAAIPPPAKRRPCVDYRTATFDQTLLEVSTRRSDTLTSLPTCPIEAPTDRDNEQVWRWTVVAVTSALRGRCEFAIEFDPRVKALDLEHYELIWARDPAIARCMSELAQYRTDRDRCLRDRAEAFRRAQTITDVKKRGETLTATARCPEVR